MRKLWPAGATVLWILALAPTSLLAQDAGDREAIVAASLDYLEGWYAADTARMSRAVHPDLAKRIARTSNGVRRIDHMGRDTLVAMTGRRQDSSHVSLRDRIRILDVFGNAAVVRADADGWVDYLQLSRRLDGSWVIVNVLWELRPRAQ